MYKIIIVLGTGLSSLKVKVIIETNCDSLLKKKNTKEQIFCEIVFHFLENIVPDLTLSWQFMLPDTMLVKYCFAL